ncbi:MAG: transketolase [Alphaproteobacteria bacterium]
MLKNLKKLADAIRFLSVDMVNAANSGHPGAPMGMADVATVLFTKHLQYSPQNPKWKNRDRFILSNGHASALLYSLFYLTGYEDCSLEDLKDFRQLGSKTAGHPEYGMLVGIETTTGPLGQGLANGVGMALGEKLFRESCLSEETIINHKTYVFVGDGCLEEGISYEATSLAGLHRLNNLIVLWDNNGITIDGTTALARSENMHTRFESIGWKTLKCDGHNFNEIDAVLAEAKKSDRPVFIDCETIIAKGCHELEDSQQAHGAPIGGALREQMSRDLDWNLSPFDIPTELLNAWRLAGRQFEKDCSQWQKKFNASTLTKAFYEKSNLKSDLALLKEAKLYVGSEATRSSFQYYLNNTHLNKVIGGSADLSPSNKTFSDTSSPITSENLYGNYFHYGVREHAMGGMMNGLALYGFIPYGGTFLVFSDYMKNPIRLASLMKIPTKFIFTHDSFWVGEDGPTHQPIEQIEMLRMIPDLNVFRPCDAIETIECCDLVFRDKENPAVLLFSRQKLPILRHKIDENLSQFGGYILKSSENSTITLIATGSEVSLAFEIAEKLEKEQNKNVCVVSMPCRELFDKQSEEYKESVLPKSSFKIAIEAGSPNGWYKYADKVFGLESFGHSAKGKDVAEKLNFTADKIYQKIKIDTETRSA